MNAVLHEPPVITHEGKAIKLPKLTAAQWRTMVYRCMSAGFLHGLEVMGAAVAVLYFLSGIRGKGELVRLCALSDEQLEPELVRALNENPPETFAAVGQYIAAKASTFNTSK